MKKKIVIALIVAVALGTGVFAYNKTFANAKRTVLKPAQHGAQQNAG